MESFGRRALQATSIRALAELEKAESRNERFVAVDALVGELLVRSLRAERIITMVTDDLYITSVTINGLTLQQRRFLDETFALEKQQSRGAWFFPEKVSLSASNANFAWYFRQQPRFVRAASAVEMGRVLAKSSADAIFFWSVLQPLFEKLLRPFALRAELIGTQTLEQQLAEWQEINSLLLALGFRDIPEMKIFRPRGGWSRLKRSGEQMEARRLLLEALAQHANVGMGTPARLFAILPLLSQYYKKARTTGQVRRKQVLTKTFQPLLIGFFGGDWLALLDYLGETPHPDEQIITALAKPQLRVKGASRAEEIARQQGIPLAEVQRIASALWQDSTGVSPVEQRVACLKRYWHCFDQIHESQQPGMKSLWGLVEESAAIHAEPEPDSPFQPYTWQELIPSRVRAEIETLWSTIMLTKWPERLVTEPFPHYLMAQTFGPALHFWHGCALTAWFLCEGPYSRTDMAGLAHYHRYHLKALKDAGTPIDESLFAELIAAEKHLGVQEEIREKSSSMDTEYGITLTLSVSSGRRRKGFEKLRDIITHHRRNWASTYLDSYLRVRWETELKETAQKFQLLLGEKGGRAPTLKQFAKPAMLPANHWFGGNISHLYSAIGEKSPVEPAYEKRLPADITTFVNQVAKTLPSRPFEIYEGRIADETDQGHYKRNLAELSLKYIQIEEAHGQEPELKDMRSSFAYRYKVLSEEENEAWLIFRQTLRQARETSGSRVL
jgi:hypothetical protein